MRTRATVRDSLDSCHTTESAYYISGNGVKTERSAPVPFSFKPLTYVSSFEASSDLSKTSTRKSWNDYTHYERRSSISSGSKPKFASWMFLASGFWYDTFVAPGLYWWYSDARFGPLDNPTIGLPVMFESDGFSGSVPLPNGLDEVVEEALKALLPGIRPNLSLINSIIELKDFKTMPRTLKRISTLAQKGNRTLRQILGGGADAYLQKEFNVMPLLADISGYSRAAADAQRQVDKLLAQENKKLRHHYYSDISHLYGDDTSLSFINNSHVLYAIPDTSCASAVGLVNAKVLGGSEMARLSSTSARFHAEIEYSYYFSSYERENAKLLGLLDVLGVNFNPAIIWNALPWSFVVDWVLGVSRWLDQFKLPNLDPVTIIHRFLYSVEVDRSVDIHLNVNVGGPLPTVGGTAVQLTEESYRRVCGLPGITRALRASGISPKEFILGGALALSRRKRRK